MGLFDRFKKVENEPEWTSLMPKAIVDMMVGEIKRNPQACNSDQIPGGIGLFGREKTNPVPVFGIPSNEKYLSKLRFKNGERIRWRRNGSLTIESIWGSIDEYDIFNLNGDTVCQIYISPYHLKISEQAPEGFFLVK